MLTWTMFKLCGAASAHSYLNAPILHTQCRGQDTYISFPFLLFCVGRGGGMCVCLLFCYTIVTVFQLYHGGDMMYEMRKKKPKPTLLLTRRIFNLPHYICMV